MIKRIQERENERVIFSIIGMSGLKRSTFLQDCVNDYKVLFPDNIVHHYSKLSTNLLPANMLRNSLVILEDIQDIDDEDIETKVYELATELLCRGKHHNISVAYVSSKCYVLPGLTVSPGIRVVSPILNTYSYSLAKSLTN